jgi:hypothetical protein
VGGWVGVDDMVGLCFCLREISDLCWRFGS